jgi:3-hydroxy-9,10-secoandrosta-1,3,5(10)-triene-9,17-dione monooxygenase reductase component
MSPMHSADAFAPREISGMNHPLPTLLRPHTDAPSLKDAMRRLIGGVVVITAGLGDERTGLTATSAVSLSMDPPTMLITVNRGSSSWPVIAKRRHFCVNILHAGQEDIAARFAGAHGAKGVARYAGADWTTMGSGALGLVGALAIIDCDVEEIIERHSHAIVLGAVRDVQGDLGDGEALVYGHGRFGRLNLL